MAMWKLISRVWLFVTSRIVARQTPLSLQFFRQEYWNGLPFPSLGDPSDPEIKSAGVQPQLIQGIRRRDGIGEGQETTA